jgi:hypothetical protein
MALHSIARALADLIEYPTPFVAGAVARSGHAFAAFFLQ